MAEQQRRQLFDEVLDRFVFGPVGVAAAVARVLPSAADEGRKVLQGPIQTAQFVSQMAAGVVRARYGEQLRGVEERIGDVSERVSALRSMVEQVGGGIVRTVQQTVPRPGAGPREQASHEEPASASTHEAGPSATASASAGEHSDSVGGIEAYATLSAAEVIERLGSLSSEQLAEVELFELDHRRRRTVLARIAKLREERSQA